MSEENNNQQATEKTYTEADYNKALERARNFEAKFTDFEKKYEESQRGWKEENENLKRQLAQKSDNPEDLDKWKNDVKVGLEKEYGEQLTGLKTQKEQIEAKLKKVLITDRATSIAAGLFNDDAIEFIRMKVEMDCDLDGEDIRIKGEDGFKRSKADPTKPMSINEYLQSIAEAHPSLAKPKGKGGTDTGQKKYSNGNTDITPQDYASMTPEQRSELRAKIGQFKIGELARAALKQ